MTDQSPASAAEIVVSGHLCVDLLPQISTIDSLARLLPGHLYEVGPMTVATGGCASNTALSLHRLGVNVKIMAPVGNDLMGQSIIGYLRGVDPALADGITVQADQSGSYTIVLNPPGADRTFLHSAGSNAAYGPESIDFDAVAKAKIFHMGYPPLLPRLTMNGGEALRTIYQRAKGTHVVTSMDMVMGDPEGPNARLDWPAILKNALPHVDIFIPSIEEMLLFMRRKDYDRWKHDIHGHLTASYLDDFADELISMGAVIAGFKLGELGIYLRTSGDPAQYDRLARLPIARADWTGVRAWQPAFQVGVAGTTGAGDAAYGGFLGALLRGWKPERALQWACAVGACCVEAVDSNSGVLPWEKTQQRLDAGWPTRPERIPGFGS